MKKCDFIILLFGATLNYKGVTSLAQKKFQNQIPKNLHKRGGLLFENIKLMDFEFQNISILDLEFL